ncbi:MAG TPA: hypothetical protein VK951_00385, partial [Miltoncostaeaceae bacterium]|nr:hypothetical protein [Miltoncostaeaceae bacterium]
MEGPTISPTAAVGFPQVRMRRLRAGEGIRRMVRETRLSADRLVLPLFAIEGRDASVPIPSLPGHSRLSPDLAARAAVRANDAGVPAVLVFGVTDRKDGAASAAYEQDGPAQAAVAAIKDAVPEMVVITDVCLCGYTDHGHCGVVVDGEVHNDLSLELLARTAVSHADVGADVVAPSDMMDGRVAAIRAALDAEGHEEAAILAYSAKYASAFYGPFREAA